MKALTLPKAAVGKSLLAVVAISLLLGLAAGEAAAVTVSGKVTLDGPTNGIGGQTVVATTDAASGFCFLNQAKTSTDGSYSFTLPATATCVDANGNRIGPDIPITSTILVFVDTTDVRFVADVNDKLVKSFPSNADITADFHLVTGKPLEGNVTDAHTTPTAGAVGVTVFATDGPSTYKFLGQTLTAGTGCGLTFTCGDYTLFVAAGQQVELAVDTTGTIYASLLADPTFIRDFLPSASAGCDPFSTANKWCVLDFLLVSGITVTGHVTDADGITGAIGGALVEAFFVNPDTTWTWLDDSGTDQTGFYSVKVPSNLSPILLRVTKTGYLEERLDVPLCTDCTTQTKDITLVKQFINVTVHVTNATTSGALGGASVTVIQSGKVLTTGTTNSSGDFVFQVAPNSSLTIQVSADKFLSASQSVTVGVASLTVNFALSPAPTTDEVKITKAVWKAGTLTVFATSSAAPNATLTATVSKGSFSLTSQMTYSSARNQYELKLGIRTNLVGGTVTVTSSLKGTATATITSK